MSNEDPRFSSTRDDFNRKPFAKRVISLLEHGINISPLVIESGWGTGKTTFCKQLITLINDERASKLRPVYIDAFQADRADQPLMTLLAAILELFPKEEDKEKIRQIALPTLRFDRNTSVVKSVVELLEQPDENKIEGSNKTIQNEGDARLDLIIKSRLSEHENVKKSIHAFQKLLETIARKKTIVLFIDELDRCRPDFVMAILETIKYLFEVTGVKFVVMANFQQLQMSTIRRYGVEAEAKKFLDKFIRRI